MRVEKLLCVFLEKVISDMAGFTSHLIYAFLNVIIWYRPAAIQTASTTKSWLRPGYCCYQ